MPFQPAPYFSNPHLQTLWPQWFQTPLKAKLQWQNCPTPDGDHLELGHFEVDSNAPWALVLHGLEGSIRSHYAKTLVQVLIKNRINPVFLHFRGCGHHPNLKPYSYHAGKTEDLRTALQFLAAQHQEPKIILGVSLGANVLLKHLGEQQEDTNVTHALAISPPFDLKACANRLQHKDARIYQSYLLRALKRSFRKKQQRFPELKTISLDNIQTLYDFDDNITAPLNGFGTAERYYQDNSCRQFLRDIRIRTGIVHALDDPFMTPACAPKSDEVADCVDLQIHDHGGHVGFIESPFKGNAAFFESQLKKLLTQTPTKP